MPHQFLEHGNSLCTALSALHSALYGRKTVETACLRFTLTHTLCCLLWGKEHTRNAFTHCDLFQQAEGAHIAWMSRQLCLQLQPDLQQLCGCCDGCLHQARKCACMQQSTPNGHWCFDTIISPVVCVDSCMLLISQANVMLASWHQMHGCMSVCVLPATAVASVGLLLVLS